MVKKNPIAKNKQDNTEDPDATSSRRDFLLKLWVGLGIAALVELIWVAASFLRPRRDRLLAPGAGAVTDAGSVESFLPGSVTAFPRGHFYLSRLHDGGFLAIDRRCTHLGCTVPWVEEEKCFVCPCHSSAYNIQGDVIRSPAPRPLDIFPITIENNMIRVSTHKPMRRRGFSPEQVVYP